MGSRACTGRRSTARCCCTLRLISVSVKSSTGCARGADANARATIDAEGFGGHTPLFNAVVCGPWPETAI